MHGIWKGSRASGPKDTAPGIHYHDMSIAMLGDQVEWQNSPGRDSSALS